MNSKKFYATRSREAINMVRTEFGPDAEIISNKIVNGWVEVTARKAKAETHGYSSFPETTQTTPSTRATISIASTSSTESAESVQFYTPGFPTTPVTDYTATQQLAFKKSMH